jgi:hypothetical protein
MSKLAWMAMLAALAASTATLAQTAAPDLHGTWKGDSESIVLGGGNTHHLATQANEPELRSVSFTLTIDKQDGRRFSGTFSSARVGSKAIGVISRSGSIYMVDAEGYTHGAMLGPNNMELCYLKQSPDARVASCVELTKAP